LVFIEEPGSETKKMNVRLETAPLGAAVQHPIFVSGDATQKVLAWGDMIAQLREAYAVPHTHAAHPRRVVTRGEGSWMRALCAAPSNSRFMGAKLFGAGRKKGVNYLIVLFDQESGGIAGFVDGNHVTACRTGATSAVAVDRMAPQGEATLGVLGSGTEALSHTRAIAQVRRLSAVRVFSTTPDRREAFAARIQTELGVPCTAVTSAEAAVKESTIVVAAARSHGEKPILYGNWLQPGMLVVSIGSTVQEQREIDVSVVEACDLIVCDAVEEVVEETGDMIAAKAAGIAFDHKMMSLSDALAAGADKRIKQARLPMFKSVGAGVQDIAIAGLAFTKAVEQGLATELPIAFMRKSI
jgi:ornithine cyclodeaminase/alanine dehydrogenase